MKRDGASRSADPRKPVLSRITRPIVQVVSFCLCSLPLSGQWTGGPTGPVYYNGGNVGIGTTNPASALVVSSPNTADMFVGSGIVNGRAALRLYGQTNSFAGLIANQYYVPGASLYRVAAGGGGWLMIDTRTGSTAGDISFATWGDGAQDSSINAATVMTVKNSGNVGIGTAAPQYKLAVNGTIGTKEVIVTNTGWADYVFKPDYRLPQLSEVKAYIAEHHQLPDMPSEAEVKEKGLGVGEMQAKLLAKIEELTLHVIRLDEENRDLKARLMCIEPHAL